jgi:hypothetical protein
MLEELAKKAGILKKEVESLPGVRHVAVTEPDDDSMLLFATVMHPGLFGRISLLFNELGLYFIKEGRVTWLETFVELGDIALIVFELPNEKVLKWELID